MDLSVRSDREIAQWIFNYEEKSATDQPLYHRLLEERARRGALKNKLDIETSLAGLREAAVKQGCTTYGALAAASNVPWATAHRAMSGAGGHLDQLLDVCHARGLPLLTALCVNQGGLETGELDLYALRGFCAGARRLGYKFADDLTFHHEQRDASWAWGRTLPG
ncbi:hypothetical protein [Phenylobacterium sp.]|uniref:hypothetical protein n=1 Tax=Phenylobacterium sp. TaxID=1871053 RepID=UPI002FE0983E